MPDSPARAYAREVLSRPEFQAPKPYFKLEEWMPHSLPVWLGWGVFAVLVVALVGVALRVLESRGLLLKGPSRAKISKFGLAEILDGQAVTPEAALGVARQAIQAGNLRQALWIGHRLLLYGLNDVGALNFRPWKTNGTYLRECSQQHPSFPLLVDFTQDYEQVVYRHSQADSTSVARLLDRLQTELEL